MINIVFSCFSKKGAVPLFREVARRIEARERDMRTHVALTDSAASVMRTIVSCGVSPTIHIQMERHRWVRPWRGHRCWHPRLLGKIEECTALEALGIPVPKWQVIEPETSLDRAEWGPYVVVKPALGRRGAYVRIHRTGRVRYRSPQEFPKDHPGRRGPMIAQNFVYTGRFPVSYRVLTYFGEPVMAIRYEGEAKFAPLESRFGFMDHGGRSIVATSIGCRISLCFEEDIIELARRTCAAFPEVPSLGSDIVRDAETGKLYVLEVNSYGNSWTLAGHAGERMMREFSLDFLRQFDAPEVITRRTIEVARERAR